jgi:hypothetical protein
VVHGALLSMTMPSVDIIEYGPFYGKLYYGKRYHERTRNNDAGPPWSVATTNVSDVLSPTGVHVRIIMKLGS